MIPFNPFALAISMLAGTIAEHCYGRHTVDNSKQELYVGYATSKPDVLSAVIGAAVAI